MLTRYFKEKIKTRKFDDDLLWSMGEIKGKRVILLGAGEDFVELNKRYFFNDVLNIVAIADKKFEKEPVETFKGIRAITPKQIEKLPNGIIGIARTESQQELAEYYSMADVFVNLTYLDTFPTVNLEALACGTPVITYRTGGSPEAIDESTGIVVDQGNLEELVKSIKYLREHPLSSCACRERAESLFDKDKCFEEYIRLYESLI